MKDDDSGSDHAAELESDIREGGLMNNAGHPHAPGHIDRRGAVHPGLARAGRSWPTWPGAKAGYLKKYFLGNRSLGAFEVA